MEQTNKRHELNRAGEADSTSCGGDSIEEDLITIKTNNMENGSKNDGTLASRHQHEPTNNYGTIANKRRPDSLKLSFDYGSTSDLANANSTNSNVNQNKSLSVTFNSNNKSHDGKKSTSYDLWVNENVTKTNSSCTAASYKDIPGKVSFR